jgi:hypothetical protein
MFNKLEPREKRLLIIMAITPWLALLTIYGGPYLNPQTRHLRAIAEHIKTIEPQWKQFQANNPGFEKVRLFGYTDFDGVFSADGEVQSAAHVEKLREFMESTSPPRPIWLDLLTVREHYSDPDGFGNP